MTSAQDAPAAQPSYGHELRLAVQRLSHRMKRERTNTDLSDSQLGVLIHLDLNGPSTPGQLSDAQRITPPAITRVISDLEARGYVTRARSEEDGRSIVVTITDDGRTRLTASRQWYNEWVEAKLATLSDAESAIVRAATPILRRLADQ